MADTTYVVQHGDTMPAIARDQHTTVDEIMRLNKIINQDLIYVGQTLRISGSAVTVASNKTSKAITRHFGLKADTDRTIFDFWKFDKTHVAHYEVVWSYANGDDNWIIGEESQTTDKYSLFTAPETATKIKFKVKPIATKYTPKGKKNPVAYWSCSWSTEKIYDFINDPPTVPDVPDVELDGTTLTYSLENIDVNSVSIEFNVVRGDDTELYHKSVLKINELTRAVSGTVNVEYGWDYRVRCRGVRGNIYGEWSDYAAPVTTPPQASSGISKIYAKTSTSVYLEWGKSENADSYEIEYSTDREDLIISYNTSTTTVEDSTHVTIQGLESGKEYFFRLRPVNEGGNGSWTAIESAIVGKKPTPPTTWSTTTKCVTGEPLTLYWSHNSQDGSLQNEAVIELKINGTTSTVTVDTSDVPEDEERVMNYSIDTSLYLEGTNIKWRVKTKGVLPEYSDWSIERSIDIYARPTLSLSMTNSSSQPITQLTSFPFWIVAVPGPNTQTPTGYNVSIVSNQSYETVNEFGEVKYISAGEEIFSKIYNISTTLRVQLSAGDISLENNISYTIKCSVHMSSGLTVEDIYEFDVAWDEVDYEPDAEIGFEPTNLTAVIKPYCEDEDGVLISNLSLSVYRREFDGGFVELARGLDNLRGIFVTDPHPALDFARYRIVAMDTTTGAISYADIPGYEVGITSIIIQWNERWSTFDTSTFDPEEEPDYSGSILELPYNVDVSESNSPDVSMIEYIGRKHSVSYYGTQLGETMSLSSEIPKSDEETLYLLRRLSRWMGDVYVRIPSGVGYWANVNVSFSQKHRELTIPVTINVTRVSGGA